MHLKALVDVYNLCFNLYTLIHPICFPDFRIISSKFCIFRFLWKNVNITLRNWIRIIFGFDWCIWKLLLLSSNIVQLHPLIHSISLPDSRIHQYFHYYDMCKNMYHLALWEIFYRSPDQSGMFSRCLNCNLLSLFIQYIFLNSRFLSKFRIFKFLWKNVNIFLKPKMKDTFGFDQRIWKIVLLSVTFVQSYIEWIERCNWNNI